MKLSSGYDLHHIRQRYGVALDAVAKEMGLTFVEVIAWVEENAIVGERLSTAYLAAIEKLRTNREYWDIEDTHDERRRLGGKGIDSRPERAGLKRSR